MSSAITILRIDDMIKPCLYFYEIVPGSLFHRQNLSPLPLPAQLSLVFFSAMHPSSPKVRAWKGSN
uniref:Uncharacterized protein n=1 Tax=Salix viminalis TaxID=40686 RepID=A0A6N2L7L6_SALVM